MSNEIGISDMLYYEKMQVRDAICKLVLRETVEDNYLAQGWVMRAVCLTENEATYPDDTWVGTLRGQGWRNRDGELERRAQIGATS